MIFLFSFRTNNNKTMPSDPVFKSAGIKPGLQIWRIEVTNLFYIGTSEQGHQGHQGHQGYQGHVSPTLLENGPLQRIFFKHSSFLRISVLLRFTMCQILRQCSRLPSSPPALKCFRRPRLFLALTAIQVILCERIELPKVRTKIRLCKLIR